MSSPPSTADASPHVRVLQPNGTSPRRRLRPWYAPGWIALLVAGTVGSALVAADRHNFDPYEGQSVSFSVAPPPGSYGPAMRRISALGNFTISLEGFSYGWPLRYREYWVQKMVFAAPANRAPVVARETIRDSHRARWTNWGLAGLVVLSSFFAVNRIARGRWQFGLRGLLVATTTVAVACSLWSVRWRLEAALGQGEIVARLFEMPAWLYGPILLGLALTLLAAVWALFAPVLGPLGWILRRRAS